MAQDTLTVTDNRTKRTCNLLIEKDAVRAMDLRQIKTGPEDFGTDDLRSGFHEYRFLPQQHHFHRRRPRHSALSRLPHRSAGRALQLPRSGLPAAVRRAAHADGTERTGWRRSRTTPCCTKPPRSSWRVFATMPIRWRMLVSTVAALSTVYPGCQGDSRPAQPPASDQAPDWQDAVDRRHVLPAQSRISLRVSGQRSELYAKTS